MSIVRLKKITLFGLTREKQKLLADLQALGCLHLIVLGEHPSEPEKKSSERPEDTLTALKFLLDCPIKRHQLTEENNFVLEATVDRVLQIKQLIREVSDLRDTLAARIKEVVPWGDFTFPSDEDLAGLKFWFYTISVGKIRLLPKQDLIWQIVHKDNRFAYVVVIAKQEPEASIMPVPRTHIGKLSLSELNRRLNKAELEIEDLQAERESLSRWIFLLSKNLARAEDKASLLSAAEKTLDAGTLFAVQGWAPVFRVDALLDFVKQHQLAMQVDEPTDKETPPTLLENPELLAAGEDLVSFYQTPSYWDWDPAIPVFFSFVVFFAMIISDAGYGALLGICLLIIWRSKSLSPVWKRLWPLALTLVISSIVWGVLVGSYFGIAPDNNNLLGQLKIFDLNDFDSMMRLSIYVGVLHLSLANFFKAKQFMKQGIKALVPIGWVAIMWGAVLLWFDDTFVTPADWFLPVGQWLFGFGMLMVFLFSGKRRMTKPLDLLLKLFDGLRNLSGITKIFGDVLSYLRLFALGLASASLALTFNSLAANAREIEGLGLLYSLLIILIGHTLNLLLSLMSAVVHGMRLNCIEFFNWGLSNEGFSFKAFAKKEIQK